MSDKFKIIQIVPVTECRANLNEDGGAKVIALALVELPAGEREIHPVIVPNGAPEVITNGYYFI